VAKAQVVEVVHRGRLVVKAWSVCKDCMVRKEQKGRLAHKGCKVARERKVWRAA
jgi:hypothetical protein